MQNNKVLFHVDPDTINEIFHDFLHKSPFNLKNSIKAMMKEYNYKEKELFYGQLVLELQASYRNVKQSNYIYHNGNYYKIAILKYRMQDLNSNSGKSSGWRVIALIDELNGIYYLLDLYKHSKGKDNLTNKELTDVKAFCDEYAESL